MLLKKILLPAVLIVCLAMSLIGCSTNQAGTGDDTDRGQGTGQGISREEQTVLMDDFDALVAGSGDIDEIIKYVDDNISKLSPENASQMITGLEKAQQDYLPEMEARFYPDGIAQKFFAVFQAGGDINDPDTIKDQEIKQLVQQTKNAGYKVDTAEGMYYPVIDYQRYREYSSLVTPDIKAYIDIMAAHSNNPPAKDAALVIGWDELLSRALQQEKFVDTYADSAKLAGVRDMYRLYVQFVLFGLNNTPLFSYDDKAMSPDAKTGYARVLAESEPSRLTEIVQGFLDLVEQNNNRLTGEVEKYRQKCLEDIGIAGID